MGEAVLLLPWRPEADGGIPSWGQGWSLPLCLSAMGEQGLQKPSPFLPAAVPSRAEAGKDGRSAWPLVWVPSPELVGATPEPGRLAGVLPGLSSVLGASFPCRREGLGVQGAAGLPRAHGFMDGVCGMWTALRDGSGAPSH
jgi:hypothetical protein